MNFVENYFRMVKSGELQPAVKLRPHQEDFVDAANGTDGILAVHGLGTGKTLSSIAAVESNGGPANVFVPAALRTNYKKDLSKFVSPSVGADYAVKSYDAAGKGAYEDRPVMVADEVQRLRNQGKAYEGVMNAAQSAEKRILLSGTPMVNGPGDLAAIINILHGKQIFDQEGFEQKFVAPATPAGWFHKASLPGVRNEKKLKELLEGRVHYVKDVTDSKPKVSENEVRVPMGDLQDQWNKNLANQLPFWARYKLRKNLPPSKKESVNMNAFLGAMRQNSISPAGLDVNIDPLQAFHQSPKLTTSFDILKKELKKPDGKVMVYSNYIGAGLQPYAAALNHHKIPHVMFYGGMSDGARKKAVEDYNSGHARVVLIGPAGSEGISLRGTSRVQLLDPHWNEARTEQAKGRAVRLDSHLHLPVGDRKVTVDKFVSEPKRSLVRRLLGRPAGTGTDEYLYTRAAEKQKLIDDFTRVLREVSVR